MFKRRSLKLIFSEFSVDNHINLIARRNTIRSISTTEKPEQNLDVCVNGFSEMATDYVNSDVFSSKDTFELLRSYLILKASSIDTFVSHSDKIFLIGRRLLWRPFFDKVMSSSFYGQFAAGTNIETSRETVMKLRESGVRSMMCVPIESVKFEDEQHENEILQSNFEIVKGCICGTATLESNGFAQVKLTALCNKELLVDMNKYLLKYEKDHCELGAWNFEKMLKQTEANRFEDINIPELGPVNNKKLQLLLRRMDEMGKLCKKHNVRMMLDAEQTYIQAALGYLILLLQAKYNKEEPIVYSTYQCFRKDTLDRIKADYDLGQRVGFKNAGKLVRGAYMIEERALASKNGYPDPINDTFEETTEMYHACVNFLLPMISRGNAGVMIASHNEQTADFVKNRMNLHNIPRKSPYICFGQLYGMCDHVSFHLGKEGYETFKSVPYGTIDDTILYLSRRAHENKSVLERTKFERLLISQELKRRMENLIFRQSNSSARN